MRILTTLAMLLASFIPSLGATTWPASTNAPNQTFYGNNNFLGNLTQNGVPVLTNAPATSVTTNSGYGVFGSGAFSPAGGSSSGVTTNAPQFNSDSALNTLFSTKTRYFAYGDSITQGAYVTNSYVGWLTNLFTFNNFTTTDWGVSSYHINDVSNLFYGITYGGARCYTNAVSGSGSNSMMSFWIGINDVLYDTVDTNAWIANYTNMWWTAHTNGINPVIVFTIEDSKLLSQSQETIRLSLNSLIRTNCYTNASWTVCMDNDIILPSTNTTYFLYNATANYGLHPTDYGQQQVAIALGAQLYLRSNLYSGMYILGMVESSVGFSGNGRFVTHINPTNIDGTIPTVNLPIKTLVTSGTGISITASTNNGVITWTPSVSSISATPSAKSKRVWSYSNTTGTTIAGYGITPGASGSSTSVAAAGTVPKHSVIYTTAVAGNYANESDSLATVIVSNGASLTWMVGLTNTGFDRVNIGLTEYSSGNVAEDPTNTIRRYVMFVHTATNSANWYFLTSDNTGSAPLYQWSLCNNAGTPIASDTAPHVFNIEIAPGLGSVIASIDGIPVATNTTHIPDQILFSTTAICASTALNQGLQFFQFYGEQPFP